ncbi:MAG: methyltransferase [Pseudomonadota bacterium]
MAGNQRLWYPLESGAISDIAKNLEIGIWRARPDPGLGLRASLKVIQSFRPYARRLTKLGVEIVSNIEGQNLSMVEVTRSKSESLALIAEATSSLIETGYCIVDGLKTDGIDSIYKSVRRHCDLLGTYSKAHGRVFWFRKPSELPDAFREWLAKAKPTEIAPGYMTQPGVFAEKGVDTGSQFLLAHLPDGLTGDVADLGAGWGWLSNEVLKKCPAITSLSLFEAEGKALDCSRLNVKDVRAHFHWADVTKEALGSFDVVIMNPPFHETRIADTGLGVAFITAAAAALKRGGTLYMVANKHLPYEGALNQRFAKWEQVATSAQFKIIVAKRPKGK